MYADDKICKENHFIEKPPSSIECCARPPLPQVMKVCFILVLGHRYETCTLVFYRGVFIKKTVAQSALMPHYSIEKIVSKKTCAPLFYRGCFAGGTRTPTIYIRGSQKQVAARSPFDLCVALEPNQWQLIKSLCGPSHLNDVTQPFDFM